MTNAQRIKNHIRKCLEVIKQQKGMTPLEGSRFLDGYCTCLFNYDVVTVSQAKAIHKALMKEEPAAKERAAKPSKPYIVPNKPYFVARFVTKLKPRKD